MISFTNLLITLKELKKDINKLNNDVIKLEKSRNNKIIKLQKKAKNKKKRKLSGFAKPLNVTNDLCKFMGKGKGTKMARTEVTKYLIKYIKDNNLQNNENKKNIIPDKRLKHLLKLKKQDELTYFNLQKYMNIHYIKH
jgi:chromatin remodeling complex protein RSC6